MKRALSMTYTQENQNNNEMKNEVYDPLCNNFFNIWVKYGL